jgi:hypothetical protein
MWCSQFLQHTMLLVTMIITSVKSDEYKALPTIIQTPVEKYSHLLNHSILFYEAQRSGKLPQNNRISW